MKHHNVFSQLCKLIPQKKFEDLIFSQKEDYYSKSFSAKQQLLVMLFAQINKLSSLREIETDIFCKSYILKPFNITKAPKSTLSEAMIRRNSNIFEAIFYELLEKTQKIFTNTKHKFSSPLKLIDSTTISLCLSRYNWAHYRRFKGAIKLHTEIDFDSRLPCFIFASNGKMSDIRAAKEHINISPDSIYCFDRGYVDFNWFNSIDAKGATFVTRTKKQIKLEYLGQHAKTDESKGIIEDLRVWVLEEELYKKYPKEFRLVKYYDNQRDKVYEFITNDFSRDATEIADIYKARWEIEIFFKWIKQNLRIKSFIGTSKNAVMSQVWVALIYYLLVAYLRFLSKSTMSLTEVNRKLRGFLGQKLLIAEFLALNDAQIKKACIPKQNPQLKFNF